MENPNQHEWEPSIERLREKWTEFTDGIFLSIREEEMRLRREELEKCNDAHSQRCAPLRLVQKQGGWNG